MPGASMSKREQDTADKHVERQVTFRSPNDLIAQVDKLAGRRGYDRSQVIRFAIQLAIELGEMEPELIRPFEDRADTRTAIKAFCARQASDKRRA